MADVVRDMKTVVLDIGSGTVRAGLAGGDEPASFFPTIIGRNRYNKHDKTISVGDEAESTKGVLKLSYPVEHGIVMDWDDMQCMLSYIYKRKVMSKYNPRRCDSWEHPVLCTETPLNPMSNREQMAQIMFETFNVPALSIEIPGVLSLFASNRKTGIALDCGEGVSYAVPLYEGNVILDAVLRSDLAGRDLTVALEQFVDRKCQFVANAKREHMRLMKEEFCYVAPDYDQENTASRINSIRMEYKLPDGNWLDLDVERFKCAEVLFRPSVIENMESQPGVHELLHRSLMKCRDGIKDVLCDNIVLTGGSTMFRGFEYRINKELTKLVYRDHGNQKIEVVAPPQRQNTAWIGGSMMASLSSYHKSFITIEEYNEVGPNIGSKKSLWINRSQLDTVNEDGMAEDETTPHYYYDVFLSFRGADTRQGFTNDLYNALNTEGIKVFRDDDELKIGDKIEVILKAIDNSRICIPVLSPNFANSSWCLREVERMVNLKKDIVPIFFNVATNDVKLETNLYADALLKHEVSKGKYTVQRWRDALKEIPKLKGRKLREQEDPLKFIKQIVKEILVKLNFKPRYDIQHLVQVPDQVEGALKLLGIGYGSKRLVAIQGLPGIGKTTLAKVIFNQIYRDFDCSAFLEDVRESLQGSGNLHFLREALLKALDPMLKDVSIITEPYEKLKTNFRNKKVLVVLDDVNDRDQVYDLVGDSSWFGSESRIIITTGDKRVLESTNEISSYSCYALEMKEMNSKQALELFSKYAFGKHCPPSNRIDLAIEVVSAAGLLPLALESVGSFLQNQEEQVWKNTINKLKEEPNHALQKKLKQSFDSLDVQQQQIFIDIACFLTEDDKKEVIYVWEACGFLLEQEIKGLLSLSMIEYDTDKKCFKVQDQLRHFARLISRQNPRLRRSNESWKDKDAICLLNGKMENEKFEALSLRGTRSEDQDNFSYVAIFNTETLRRIIGDFTERLQKLEWSSPKDVDLLGSNLCLRNVAILCLKGSSVDENWQGWKAVLVSEKLKVLDLTECSNLTCAPSYLSEAVNLEELVLRYCKKLISIASIQRLSKLKALDVRGCELLNGLPKTLSCLEKLTFVDLSKENIYNVHTTPTALLSGFDQLLKLEYLMLKGHHELMMIPESIGELKSLVKLDLSDTGISELPWTIGKLLQLQILDLTGCYRLQVLPASIGNLITLTALNLEGTSIGWLPFYVRNLKCTVAK